MRVRQSILLYLQSVCDLLTKQKRQRRPSWILPRPPTTKSVRFFFFFLSFFSLLHSHSAFLSFFPIFSHHLFFFFLLLLLGIRKDFEEGPMVLRIGSRIFCSDNDFYFIPVFFFFFFIIARAHMLTPMFEDKCVCM